MLWFKRHRNGSSARSPERLFVHHHLGLGDTFTVNAIVRRLAKLATAGELHLFAKECNVANVRFLYRDDPRIRVVPLPLPRDNPVGEHALVQAYVRAHHAARHEYVRIGFEAMNALHRRFGTEISCDQSFYVQAGLPYELRFTEFHLMRDLDLEEQAYQRFNPSGEPFAFVDADPGRGMLIPTLGAAFRAGADPKLPRLFNNPTIPLLHMGLILERAREIHVCESSIRCLLEGTTVFQPQAQSLFLHAFRGKTWGANTALPWIEIGLEEDDVTRPLPFQRHDVQRELIERAMRSLRLSGSRDPLRRALSQVSGTLP